MFAVVTNLLRQIQRAMGGGVLTAEGVWNALMVASSRTAPGMPPLIGENDRAASSNGFAIH